MRRVRTARVPLTALGVLALAVVLGGSPAASVQGAEPGAPTSDAPDSTDTAPAPGGDVAELPPIDPALLADASSHGEAAAIEIRTRIRELAQARLDAANSESAAAQATLDAASQRLLTVYAGLQREGEEIDRLQFTHREAVGEYDQARRRLGRNAAYLYTRNPELMISNDLLRTGDLQEAAARRLIIRSIIDSGRREVLDTYTAAVSADPDIERRATALRERAEGSTELAEARNSAAAAYAAANEALGDVAALPADWLFPVAGDYQFSDTFLAPRMAGTAYAHRHQGADIFAAAGTPLVAVERGIVGRVGEVTLGGLRVWLLGESGTNYYYAHLSGFAPGLERGQFVEAGTVLGYVGDTGNAKGTPFHLHFQVHPDGGSAVNPTALLTQAAERDQREADG